MTMKIKKITREDVMAYLIDQPRVEWNEEFKCNEYYAHVRSHFDENRVNAELLTNEDMILDGDDYDALFTARAPFDWYSRKSWGSLVDEDEDEDEDFDPADYNLDISDFYDIFETAENEGFREVAQDLADQINAWLEEEAKDHDED